MLKSIERVTPLLHFDLRGVEITVLGVRQDTPPRMNSISDEVVVDPGEDDRRLELLHMNIRKFGTISNTVAASTKLYGTIRRKEGSA